MPYEHKSVPLLTLAQFLRRLFLHGLVALALVLVSLGIGMAGYHYLEDRGWLDAFLNAAMLLGGMGPVYIPATNALYSGLVFLVAVAIALAPAVHRVLHHLHLDESDE